MTATPPIPPPNFPTSMQFSQLYAHSFSGYNYVPTSHRGGETKSEPFGGDQVPKGAVLAWHWSNGSLAHGAKNIMVQTGYCQKVTGPIEICRWGLHGSRSLAQTFQYAPTTRNPILSRVSIWGDVQEQDDKLCGRYRFVHKSIDATNAILETLLFFIGHRARQSGSARIAYAFPTTTNGVPSPRSEFAWYGIKLETSMLPASTAEDLRTLDEIRRMLSIITNPMHIDNPVQALSAMGSTSDINEREFHRGITFLISRLFSQDERLAYNILD